MKTNEKNEIKIRVSGLSNGVHEYHFAVEPADLSLPEGFHSPITVDVTLDKTAGQIYLKGTISATSDFICDRCLDEFRQTMSSDLSLFFVYSEQESGKYPADDVHVIIPDTPYLDITDDIRQAILLAVPLKLICRDDCRGLCPHCGTNWNTAMCGCEERGDVDPRWENLKNIL